MEMTNPARARDARAVSLAMALFIVWLAATWLLEGRIETLLRPEAAVDRAVYAIVANVAIGIIAAMAVLRSLIRSEYLTRRDAGFGAGTPSPLGLLTALALGASLYLLQGVPSLDAIILANAFAQVLVVSTAEVVVIWSVVAATIEAALGGRGIMPRVAACLAASLLFGVDVKRAFLPHWVRWRSCRACGRAGGSAPPGFHQLARRLWPACHVERPRCRRVYS